LSEIDEFDQIQLRGVLQVCENAKSMADAGRQLFAASRQQRNTTNDSDRVKKYLARFGLSWGIFSNHSTGWSFFIWDWLVETLSSKVFRHVGQSTRKMQRAR
jgi:hypothetical protein